MTTSNVLEFACGAEHPSERIADVPRTCSRKRWHAGDHRTYTDPPDSRLLEWPDPPTREAIMLPDLPNSAYPPYPAELDERAESFTLAGREHSTAVRWLVVLLCWLAGATATVCTPAVVIAVYRALL